MIPPIASRFVAGESLSNALADTQEYRDDDIGTIFNLLGEHYDDPDDARGDTEQYVEVVHELSERENACVSVKPSQLGLDISRALFKENLEKVLAAASRESVFVWCDMEDSDTTEQTLETLEVLAGEYSSVMGVCVQANLRRTEEDIRRLEGTGIAIRLVKGAYSESSAVAYTDSEEIDEQYKSLLSYLVQNHDALVAVGTHDPEMISLAEQLAEEHDKDVQFQMLLGVRPNEQRRLAAAGYDVWQYAPYGSRWPSYVYRRLREGRKNIVFILRALLSRD